VTEAAALLGALGAVVVLLGGSRVALAAGLAALGAAEVALASQLVPGGLTGKLTSLAGAGAVALAVPAVAGLAALLVRYPGAVPPLVVALAPFRLPFEFGADNRFFVGLGEDGRLGRLVPLYVLVAAAGVALAWRSLRGAEVRSLPRPLAVPAALLAGLTIASLVWAYDPAAAEERLVFFIIPFTALFAVVAYSPFRAWLPRALAIEAVALACLFATLGVAQAWTKELLFYAPKIAVANSYTSYFRVTSFFDDPSIYGRHLAIGIAVLVVALWLGRIGFWTGAALAVFVWVGLFFSYSQSSMAALAAAVLVVSFLVADRRTRRALAVSAVALALVGGAFLATLLRDESAARVTSGRSTLVSDTATVVANHPAFGVGVASQPAAARDEASGARSKERAVSHTTPLTVAAELGFVGLAAYLAFLAGAVWTLAAARRANEALGLGLVAAFVVLFVHSLSYGLFFEDPFTWCVLALGAGFVATREPGAQPVTLHRLPLSSPRRTTVTRA
jgi:O-antigen ligase